MINLKQYLEKYDIIDESILDDIDDQIAAQDRSIDKKRAESWMRKSRNKPCIYVQKKGYRLGGEVIIDDIEGETYEGTPIKSVFGNISISNCKNLTSLKGLFTPDAIVDGTLTIEDCPSFVSLEGAPAEVGSLVISGNKNFKNIDKSIIFTVHNNLYLFKNGKRFDKEKLTKNLGITVGKRIMCSVHNDDELINEATINEALQSPLLHALADAIKKNTKSKKNDTWGARAELEDFISHVKLDEIKSSAVHEYDTRHNEVSKLVRAYCSGKIHGFYFTLDKDGVVKALFIQNKMIQIDYQSKYASGYLSRHDRGHDSQVSYIANAITNYDTVVFVDLGDIDNRYEIQALRRNSKNGALALKRGRERDFKNEKIDSKTLRYYQDVADENKERYKRMLNELKVKKHLQNNKFDKYKTQIDNLFDRYTALLKKMMSNHKNYTRWDLTELNSSFSTKVGYSKGLMDRLQEYFDIVEKSTDSYYTKHVSFETEISKLEPELEFAIKNVDEKMKRLESK